MPTIAVEVVCGTGPRDVATLRLTLPAGATVADALLATGWPALVAAGAGEAAFAASGWGVAVWGARRMLEQPLRDGDRLEVLRGLQVAPMDARRARYRAAGGVKALRERGLNARKT